MNKQNFTSKCSNISEGRKAKPIKRDEWWWNRTVQGSKRVIPAESALQRPRNLVFLTIPTPQRNCLKTKRNNKKQSTPPQSEVSYFNNWFKIFGCSPWSCLAFCAVFLEGHLLRWSRPCHIKDARWERNLQDCADGLRTDRKDTRCASVSPRPCGILHRVSDREGGRQMTPSVRDSALV